MLKSSKYFYFIKLKSIILNNKYLIFIKNSSVLSKGLKIKCNLILSIFNKTNLVQFIKNNYYLIIFNHKQLFLEVNNLNIYAISYSGFFINNNYIKKIYNYYLFYTNNFTSYILIIFNFIKRYTLILFSLDVKLLVLLINKINK